MSNGKFTRVEAAAVLAIGAVTTASLLNAGLSSAVEYRFTEPLFSFYNISGEFRVDGGIGTVLSGTLRSSQTQLLDLRGLRFDGSYLLGTTQSGTQFSTLPPSSGPFGGKPPQQITLASQDTVPGGFSGFSTPGYVFERVGGDPVSTPEPVSLLALGLVAGAMAGARALSAKAS